MALDLDGFERCFAQFIPVELLGEAISVEKHAGGFCPWLVLGVGRCGKCFEGDPCCWVIGVVEGGGGAVGAIVVLKGRFLVGKYSDCLSQWDSHISGIWVVGAGGVWLVVGGFAGHWDLDSFAFEWQRFRNEWIVAWCR